MPAPELEAYHPDIAQSPPTSAKLAAPSKSSPFPYETAKISVVPEVVGYHQAGNISYIDVGDSTINRPKPTVLGERQALVASKRPDRVLMVGFLENYRFFENFRKITKFQNFVIFRKQK